MDKYFNISKVFAKVKEKKRIVFTVWAITAVLSAIWIFPQPRYYTAHVSLAPEMGDAKEGGGFSVSISVEYLLWMLFIHNYILNYLSQPISW